VSLGRDALIARWTAATHRPARLLETSTPIASPPANLRALAARELAVPGRYRLSVLGAPAPQAPWWMRLWTYVSDRWTELWRATLGRAHLGRAGAVVIGDVLIAIVAVVILVVSVRLVMSIAIDRRTRAASSEPLDATADAPALYAAACECARGGEYAQASRLLFAASIAALSQRGLVRDDRSATVGDFRRTLRRDGGSLTASFDSVSSAFVISAYAERPVDASQWERARQAYLLLAGGVET
jgi:hypothetical protein